MHFKLFPGAKANQQIIQIRTCKSCNIGKLYVSSILPSIRTFVDIGQIDEVLKWLCHKNNFEYKDHQI